MEITQQQLKSGTIFLFNNEKDCILNEHDDLRGARVWFEENDRNSWASGFKIEFNGSHIGTFKTFKGMVNRLDKLVKKWKLDQAGIESEDDYEEERP